MKSKTIFSIIILVVFLVPMTASTGLFSTNVGSMNKQQMNTSEFMPSSSDSLPSAPNNFGGIAGGNSNALSWYAPNNGASSVQGYKIYRGTSSGSETLLTTIGNLTFYVDTNVIQGNIYYYEVCAYNSAGDGPKSPEISLVNPLVPTTAPQNVSSSINISIVIVSWEKPQNSQNDSILGYRIYRGTSSGNEVYITSVKDALSYTDINVTSGQTYYYQISAYNSAGIGPKSAETSLTFKVVKPNMWSRFTNAIPGYNLAVMLFTIVATIGVIASLTKKKKI